MTEMVERVARALCAADGHDPDYLEPGDALGIDGHRRNGDPAHFLWREYVPRASAALAAMREPTEEMVKAGVDFALHSSLGGGYHWPEYVADKHRRMIDAALAEERA